MSDFAKLIAAIGLCFFTVACAHDQSPIASQSSALQVDVEEFTLAASNNRTVSMKLFYPASGCQACTLIAFSHGANLSNDVYDVLIHDWVLRGFVVAAPLHVDSEVHPQREDYGREQHLPLRIEDFEIMVSHVFGADFQNMEKISLSDQYIAAGHSFGALIAQIAGGASLSNVSINLTRDPVAIVAISPPGPVAGIIGPEAWSTISKPMLTITGTQDILPFIAPKWQDHLVSYESAPEHLSLAVVFEGMDHYFNGAFGRIDPELEKNETIPVLNNIISQYIGQSLVGVSVPGMVFKEYDMDSLGFLRLSESDQ